MGGNKPNMPQSKLQGETQSEALVLASILVENQRRKKKICPNLVICLLLK